MSMNTKEFFALVRQMRTRQRLYFKSKNKRELMESIAIEREVDRVLAGEGKELFSDKPVTGEDWP